jgi:hypothetical protein
LGHRLCGLSVHVGRQAPEVAVDVLLIYEGLDALDGGLVRLGVEPSLLHAVDVDKRVVGDLVLGGDLRRRVARDALGYPACLDQNHRLTRAL